MNMYLVNRYQIPTTLDSHISNPGIKEVDYEDVKQVLKELKTYLKVPEDAVKNVRVFDVEDLLFFLENAVGVFKNLSLDNIQIQEIFSLYNKKSCKYYKNMT